MLAAVASAGASLIGGLLDKKSNEKAANTAFRYQIDLNNQAMYTQQILTGEQNKQVANLNHAVNLFNEKIDATNADILKNHSTSKSTQTDTVDTASYGGIDFGKLVKDAEAAGFNPLTVLRAGGAAGYSYSTGSTRSTSTLEQTAARDLLGHMTYFAPPQPGQANHPGTAPVAAASNAWSNAMQTGLNVWQQGNADRLAQARLDLEGKVAQAQIVNLGSETALNNANTKYRLSIPSWTGSSTRTSTGGFGGAIRSAVTGTSGKLGAPSVPDVGKTEITNPFPYGSGMTVNGSLKNAEAYEDRWGDVAASIIGAGNLIVDVGGNLVERFPKSATGKTVNAATEAAKPYFQQAYDAMVAAWNSPAWNSKSAYSK